MSFVVPPDAVSWVDYDADCPFPIQNLPLGVFRHGDETPRPCTAIGEYAVDLVLLQEAGLLPLEPVLREGERGLDPLLGAGVGAMRAIRSRLYELLEENESLLQDDHELQGLAFLPLDEIRMVMPFTVGAFVDFYSGIHHASNVGRMFRPDQPPLLPNYRWLPIGYNGRASTVGLDGVRRPLGQTKGPDDAEPIFGPTRELDFELEVGFVLGAEYQGPPMTPSQAEELMAGLVVVNDWSARDVQRWEYQPLGPFLAKSFCTTISPWLVSLDALAPFRVEGMAQEPAPLPHLVHSGTAHFDVVLEVSLQTARMSRPQTICRSNMRNLYWSLGQQLAHQASNGTALRPGDLYASGTISGPEEGTFGSMLELSWKGQQPIEMAETGETRTFLEDGDRLILSAFAQGDGYRIGFGEATGTVEPAYPMS